MAQGLKGLEIGGPSRNFCQDGILPLYQAMGEVDNLNFASCTLWEEAHDEGTPYAPEGIVKGVQFLGEATNLSNIREASYDIVLSSHCLEHIANPLRALREWQTVCRPAGYLCVIVPHRDGTFDRRRPVTLIEHFRSDADSNVDEGDETHFDEVIRLHDLRRDPGVRSVEELRKRVADNRTVRAIHHHVFDLRSAVLLIREAGWTPIAAEARRPYDILVLAQNLPSLPNSHDLRAVIRGSPFKSDRVARSAGLESV
jgi:SAM-dependent methyltransferase